MPHNDFTSFKTFIKAQGSFSDQTWDLLRTILEEVFIAKGDHTLTEGQVCRHIDYIHEGSFRIYHNKDGNEVTTGLYTDGFCITDMKSLSQLQPSNLNIIANENSIVVRLYKEKLIELYDRSPALQSLGRSILETMIVSESAWKEMYALYDPTERYEFLLKKDPSFILRFPMQHIASFLGMRRETLSRIRAKM